jgi:hypothetical protein
MTPLSDDLQVRQYQPVFMGSSPLFDLLLLVSRQALFYDLVQIFCLHQDQVSVVEPQLVKVAVPVSFVLLALHKNKNLSF